MQPFFIKFPGINPRRILIHGPQGYGKSWFAQRLAKWMRTFTSCTAVVIDSEDHSLKRRGSGVITIDTINAKPTSRQRDRYDWIIDMSERELCSHSGCDESGMITFAAKNADGKMISMVRPCTGRDCILKHFCCDDERLTPRDEIRLVMHEKQRTAVAQLAALDKITEPITAKPQDPGMLLASEMFYSIEGVAKGIDKLLAAVGSGLPFNDNARQQLRFDVTYHMSRLRGQFGGLKALVDHSAGPAPF